MHRRSTIALSRAYMSLAWKSPVMWFAMGGAVIYTAMTSLSAITVLGENDLRLQALEAGLYVFNNAYFLTFGLLFCFMIMVSTLLHPKENELLVLLRMHDRREIWIARVLAMIRLSVVFLGVVGMAWLLITVPGRPITGGWSSAYGQMLATARGNPEGLAPVYYLAANQYLKDAFTPLTVMALQASLFLLVFVTVGTFGAVLAQGIRHRALALVASVTYVFSYVVLKAMEQPMLTVFTAQSPLLLSTHTPQGHPYLSYAAAFSAWGVVLVALVLIGMVQIRHARLV